MVVEASSLLAALLDSLDDDLVIADPDGQVLVASAAARARSAGSPLAVAGLEPDAFQARSAAMRRVVACGVAETLEDQHGGRWWSVRVSPLVDPLGGPLGGSLGVSRGGEGIVGVILRARDITPQRSVDLALADCEEHLHRTFDAAGHGMAVLTLEGAFLRVNKALLDLLGLGDGAAVPPLQALVWPEDLEIAHDVLRRLEEDPETALTVRLRFQTTAGEVLWSELGAAVPRHRPGDPPRVIVHLRDVTQEQRVDERLRAAKEEAERSSRAKTRFLAAASHDLRQPLQALAMFIDVLARRETDPQKSLLIDRIEKTTEALTSLLNTLLDISRLDAGLMRCEPRDMALGPFLARLVDEVHPVAAARGLSVRFVPTSCHVHADPALVEIVVRNFLGNALRYTRVGHIVVGVRRRAGGAVELQVADSGPGIPAEHHALVFEDFHQVDNPSREKGEGLGLGLAIVRRVAALLDAPLSLVSTPGRGTRIGLTLPPAHGQSHDGLGDGLRTADPRHTEGLTVMLIDDDPAILEGLSLVLEDWGCEVLAFDGLGQLLEGLESGGLVTPPDVIVADYRLGGGATGVDAVAMIRAAVGASIPALLLSGDTAPQRLREADASGFPLLHKPIKPDALRAALADLMAGGLTLEDL